MPRTKERDPRRGDTSSPSSWDPAQYLKFSEERLIPCRDLAGRIQFEKPPSRVIDLGCGPGTSTRVILERWPRAKIVGMDSSPEMLERAREAVRSVEWVIGDIRVWRPPTPSFDLVFSNAALQWLPNHRREIVRLYRSGVKMGGAFAFQIPAATGNAWARALKATVESRRWRSRFPGVSQRLEDHALGFYYDLLAPLSRRVDLWETRYLHVLPGVDAIIEWTKGTALRPFLDRMADDDDEEERKAFLAYYTHEISRIYRVRRDGRVLFPFLRRFVIAYR